MNIKQKSVGGLNNNINPVDDFLAQRGKLPKFTTRQIKMAVSKGRK